MENIRVFEEGDGFLYVQAEDVKGKEKGDFVIAVFDNGEEIRGVLGDFIPPNFFRLRLSW